MTFEEQINQLLDCVVQNDKVGVEKMLNEGADLDYATKEVYSPLMAAVVEGNPQMVTFLLEKGADVNLVGPRYETALDMANNLYESMRRNGSTADMVTYRDIRNILKGKDAKTALELGVAFKDSEKISQKGEEAFLKALSTVARTGKKSRLVDFIDNQMNSTVDSVAASWLKEEALAGDIPSIVEALAARYENLDEADDLGNTFLHNAVIQGKEKVAAALLKVGADASVENGDGNTPLDIAIREKNPQILSVFLKKGELTPPQVQTVVHEIIDQGSPSLLETVLLVRGKDVDLKEAFLYAIQDKSDLVYRGEGLDPNAVYQQQLPMAQMILNRGMKAKGLVTKEGTPVLQACIRDPRLDKLVPSLVKNGADIATLTNEVGNTPLMMAVSKGLDDFAQELIQNGADVNKTNDKGVSPLQLAASVGATPEMIGLLVGKGADVNYELPKTHQTALAIAAENGNFRTFKALQAFYGELKEDGINGLARMHRDLSRNPSEKQEEINAYMNGIRKTQDHAKAQIQREEKRKRLEERKAAFRKTWGYFWSKLRRVQKH